ncbi:MAM domain-containing protein [Aphelenchoides besseyi]|nr:MAM domain-containing protein [Aphelenchoides besseyi]
MLLVKFNWTTFGLLGCHRLVVLTLILLSIPSEGCLSFAGWDCDDSGGRGGGLGYLGEWLGIPDLQKFLGGDIEIDFSTLNPLIKYPSLFGQFKIRQACELNCRSFDAFGTEPCRWRNEWTFECCPDSGDRLDWVRAKYSWGVEEGITIFGTEERAKRYYILVGSQEKLDPEASAMLVSDPIQCQEGDAFLKFRYWTSPRTSIRVCIRNTTTIRNFDWCSAEITKGDPGPATVLIPGSIMYDFEIVIEARNFSYDAFGFQGGVVILDDISYNATAVYNCRNIPHYEPLIPIPDNTCGQLNCEFESEEQCYERLADSGWRHAIEPTGNEHTGVRLLRRGAYAYVKGEAAQILNLGQDFVIPRQLILGFCFYMTVEGTKLAVESEIEGYQLSRLAEFSFVLKQPHQWQCVQVILQPGRYKRLQFVAAKIPNDLSYLALDEVHLLELDGDQCACKNDQIVESRCTNDFTHGNFSVSLDLSTISYVHGTEATVVWDETGMRIDSVSNQQDITTTTNPTVEQDLLPELVQLPQLAADLNSEIELPTENVEKLTKFGNEFVQSKFIESATIQPLGLPLPPNAQIPIVTEEKSGFDWTFDGSSLTKRLEHEFPSDIKETIENEDPNSSSRLLLLLPPPNFSSSESNSTVNELINQLFFETTTNFTETKNIQLTEIPPSFPIERDLDIEPVNQSDELNLLTSINSKESSWITFGGFSDTLGPLDFKVDSKANFQTQPIAQQVDKKTAKWQIEKSGFSFPRRHWWQKL